MDPAFSRPGDGPTAFEQKLLDAVDVSSPTSAQQLWLSIAQRIGLAPLMAILDEFGDGNVWVPSRNGLMRSLWGDVRNREIERLTNEGLSQRAIARKVKTSRYTVQRVAQSPHGIGPADCGKQPE